MKKCPFCGGEDGQHYELNWGDEFITFLSKVIFWTIIGFVILVFLAIKGIIK